LRPLKKFYFAGAFNTPAIFGRPRKKARRGFYQPCLRALKIFHQRYTRKPIRIQQQNQLENTRLLGYTDLAAAAGFPVFVGFGL